MNPAESTSFTIPSKQKADLSDVGIQDLEKRFRSKREMHDFLVQDCKAFLPKLPSTSIFFMKAIIKAEKDVSAYPDSWMLLFLITNPNVC